MLQLKILIQGKKKNKKKEKRKKIKQANKLLITSHLVIYICYYFHLVHAFSSPRERVSVWGLR